ncbi:unnamed protein product [Malus baccata var. baccata]
MISPLLSIRFASSCIGQPQSIGLLLNASSVTLKRLRLMALFTNRVPFTSRPMLMRIMPAILTTVDTGTNFTDHLYQALVRNGIHTFIDHHLTRGEEISPTLLQVIEESRISLIILKSKQQIVWPVFYKVDLSHVRDQTNSFGEAFSELECKFKDKKEKILAWRRALPTFIGNFVEDILVRVLDGTYLNVAKHPVGLQSCVQEVRELLGVGGNDRCVVGIWETSRIGRTTIAKAVYNAIAHKFEGSCFLADVREASTSREGVIQLQNTLLSKTLRGTKLKAVDVHEGISLIKKLLRQKKILLILDDMDELEHLNNLVEVDLLGEGSKLIYKVQQLEDDQALELLSLNAFGRKEPSNDYLRLARRAIAYAQGLPLALTIIGSHLHNKSIDCWQAILDSYDSFKGEPYKGIQRILLKSYDALDYVLQQVFLDIACFFKGRDKDYVLQIIRSSKFNVPQDCSEVLVDNAIITIEGDRILMHDLLEKMGKRIVRDESPNEPGKQSILWDHKDVYYVLTENRVSRIYVLAFDLAWHTVVFNLPSNYHPRHLVRFDVSYSGIKQLKGFKCSKLTRFATKLGLRSLERLCLKRCKKSGIRELPSSIAYLIGLRRLKVNGYHKCITRALPKLDYLDLNGCNLSESDFLVPLDCCFVSLPDCIRKFVNLWELKLSGCKRLGEIRFLSQMVSKIDSPYQDEKIPKFPLTLECLNLRNCFRLSGDEVAKLENNLLSNQQCSEVLVILPSNEVPKWFSYTSNHPTRHLLEYGCEEAFVGGHTDLCSSLYLYFISAKAQASKVAGCTAHCARLPMTLGATSSLGKKPRPHGSLDIVNDEYDQQQQRLSLSSEPADGHPKRRQIDLNVPIDIEEEGQELPSTSDNQQSLTY